MSGKFAILRPVRPADDVPAGLSAGEIARIVDEAGRFFEALQGLVAGNRLNNTYKLALIISIADLALSADPLLIVPGVDFRIRLDAISERFLELYWPQTRPFEVEYRGERTNIEHSAVLVQGNNNRNPVKVLQIIRSFREQHPAATTVTLARRESAWPKLVRECRRIVEKNPLRYLEGAEFLFRHDADRGEIVMHGLSALMLRRFHAAVVELARARWEEQIRRRNDVVFGTSSMTLRAFLFEQGRMEDLAPAREILLQTTPARCFYCGSPLGRGRTHVDHFLPYAVFSLPRIHNFVLSCSHCNTSKSDALAAREHAEHWVERNVTLGEALARAAEERHFPVERSGFYGLVRSSYASAILRGEGLWTGSSTPGERLAAWPRNDADAFLSVFDPLFNRRCRACASDPPPEAGRPVPAGP